MKHRIMSLLLVLSILLPLFSLAYAEEVSQVKLAFANAEETIFVGKTKDIKPKLENYKLKKTFTYTSADTTVATVNKSGTVKGIAAGTTTISCVASTAEGSYESSYTLTVLKAVTSINLGKNITMAPDTTYVLTATIKPEDATVKALTWSSSREKVATVDENGIITAHAKGSATITAAATDGSKKKTEITVTVKEFDVVIRSRQGADVTYGTGYGIFSIGYKSKNGNIDDSSDEHLVPLKAGTDTYTISVTNYMTRNTKRYNFSVYITQNAMDFVDDKEAEGASLKRTETEKTITTESVYDLAYQIKFKEYSIYFLIDTDEKIVKYFTSHGTGILVGKYTGDLNKEIDVHYQGGDMHDYIRYSIKNDDSSIIIKDMDGFENKAVRVDVSVAETIMNQEGYFEVTHY